MQHTIALEGIGAFGSNVPTTTGTGTTTTTSTSIYSPTLPTYQFRYGATDRFDFGIRAGNLTMLGIDGKYNFVRGRVDLAIDPGIQGTYISSSTGTGTTSTSASAAVFYGNLPLLIGINFSSRIALMLSPGIGFQAATGTTSAQYSAGSSAFLARMGAGFNFKIANSFALQPEVTALYYADGSNRLALSTGLGFVIGAQPDTSDLK